MPTKTTMDAGMGLLHNRPRKFARRANTKCTIRIHTRIQRYHLLVLERTFVIKAARCWKPNSRKLTLPLCDAFDYGYVTALSHPVPFLKDLSARNSLHHNVFCAHRIGGIGTPGKSLGTGIVVCARTRGITLVNGGVSSKKKEPISPKSNTATSDAVQYTGLPAFEHGILTIYSEPSTIVIRRALLKPPSIFSILGTCCVPVPEILATTSHDLSMSKST